MISAWGVDHGEISKSWKKLQPKLHRAGSFVAKDTDDMAQRMKVNYSQWRSQAGAQSKHQVQPMMRASERAKTNPGGKGWEKIDAGNVKSYAEQADFGRVKGKNHKVYSQAAITGRANATKHKRKLP